MLCSEEGCTNQARYGGVCFGHGAEKKLCDTKDVLAMHGREDSAVAWSNKTYMNEEQPTKLKGERGVCWRHGSKDMKKSSKEEERWYL